MAKAVKVEKVAELRQRIDAAQAMFLADFRGLSVADATDFRRSLHDSGTRVTVVKNTLMKRAAGEAGIAELDPMLEGPTAVAFVDGDPIQAAKGLTEALRRFRTLAIKGGYMDGRVLSPEDAQALATIEPREVLLARVAGAAKGQMARAAFAFQALQSRFLALVEAFREKVPPDPADAMAAETAEAAAAAEELTGEAEAAAADLRAEAGAGATEPERAGEPGAETAAPTGETAEPTAEAVEGAEPAAQSAVQSHEPAEGGRGAGEGAPQEPTAPPEAGGGQDEGGQENPVAESGDDEGKE
jgi:large subunit ribosomal protein L10